MRGLAVQGPSNPDRSLWHLPCKILWQISIIKYYSTYKNNQVQGKSEHPRTRV